MRRLNTLFLCLWATVVAYGQGFAIDPTKPVSAADVVITAHNLAFFDEDSLRVVAPEDVLTARAGRRVSPSEIHGEGNATLADADLYSYNYPSVDADGNKIMLSALMAVPTKMVLDGLHAMPNNVIIGCHVTITSNYECPTEYNKSGGSGSWQSDVGMQICYARYDFFRQPCCLVIMPDYEGYGVSKNRPHPYLYQELTARQVADAARYGLALYNANIEAGEEFCYLESGWKSVCVGYSQGGSVALATHRFIEENGLASELHFAGSVCGDGPYDPVEHLLYYILDNGTSYDGDNYTVHDAKTVTMPIVMPLILKGMCDSNPFMRSHKVSDYLSEKFLRTGVIDFINAKSKDKDNQYSTDKINDAFKAMRKNGLNYVYTDENGVKKSGHYSASDIGEMLYQEKNDNVHGRLSQIMTSEAYDYFTNLAAQRQDQPEVETPADRGVMKDLHRALASNSLVTGWTPTHRIGFYHTTYDTVVPYANLLSFMRHQNGLKYYFRDTSRARSKAAGVNPSHIVSEGSADVYIFDDDCKDDHVGGGREFYVWGSPSPDYRLIKWVLEGKK